MENGGSEYTPYSFTPITCSSNHQNTVGSVPLLGKSFCKYINTEVSPASFVWKIIMSTFIKRCKKLPQSTGSSWNAASPQTDFTWHRIKLYKHHLKCIQNVKEVQWKSMERIQNNLTLLL